MTDRYYVRSNTIIDKEDKLNNMERILSPSEACERLNNLNDEYHIMQELYEDEIDKKIAILTDAKIKCIQNEDEELLGKIKFGIQVLRELKEVILND